MNSPVVFISAASIDLAEWRNHLHTAFSRAGFRVRTQDESLGSAPGNVRRLLMDTIAESDCVIHLAGLGYGSHAQAPFPEAPEFQCSWTQFEYYHAHATGKDVIAFACAPSLSVSGFRETGDEAERKLKARLQWSHRDRVVSGKFDGTPLEGKIERTSNETIASVQNLLEATAAAVGTLHSISQEARQQLKSELESISGSLSRIESEVIETRSLAWKALKHARWLAALGALGLGAKFAVDWNQNSKIDQKVEATSERVQSSAVATQTKVEEAKDEVLIRIDQSYRLTSAMVTEKVYADVSARTGVAQSLLRQLTQQADAHGEVVSYATKLAGQGRANEGRALFLLVAETELLEATPDFRIVTDSLFWASKFSMELGWLADANELGARAIDAATSINESAESRKLLERHADHWLETCYQTYAESPYSDTTAESIFVKEAGEIIKLGELAPLTLAKARMLLAYVSRDASDEKSNIEAERAIEAAAVASQDHPACQALADTLRAVIRCSRLLGEDILNAKDCAAALAAFEPIAARPEIGEVESVRARLMQLINADSMSDRLPPESSTQLSKDSLQSAKSLLKKPQDPVARWLHSRAEMRIGELELNLAYAERSSAAKASLANAAASAPWNRTEGRESPEVFIIGGGKSSLVMASAAIETFDRLRKQIDRTHRPGSWADAQLKFVRASEILLGDEIDARQPAQSFGPPLPVRRFNDFGLTSPEDREDPEVVAQRSALQRLKQREQPALVSALQEAIDACAQASEVWTPAVNSGMSREVSFWQACVTLLLAEITPAEEAMSLYESAIRSFKAIEDECRSEGNENGASTAGGKAYLAEMRFKMLQDEITHANGGNTREELEMQRRIDRLLSR